MAGWLLIFGLALGAPVGRAVEGDIVFPRSGSGGGAFSPAVFPHWVHRIRYACYVCHDDLFSMKRGATPVTMEAIMRGEACGACHNGEVAWAVTFESCPRCHRTP